jgi:hypothetical protein
LTASFQFRAGPVLMYLPHDGLAEGFVDHIPVPPRAGRDGAFSN